MFENIIKKSAFLIAIIFLFYLSYLVKNFQLLLISFCFLLSFCFFFKMINKNFLQTLLTVLVALTIIELTLFFKNYDKIININSKKNLSKHIEYKKTYLGNQPLSGKQYHKIVSNGVTEINANYTINKNNFRHTPSINDLVKTKRLNFFGGSLTFGWGLNDDETLPYLTQDYLKKWNINNYALPGYGMHQMLAHIEKDKGVIGDINIAVIYDAHIPRATCKRDFTFGTPKYIFNKKKEIIRSGYCNFGFIDILPLPNIFGLIIKRSQIKILIDKIYVRKSLYNDKNIELFLGIVKKVNEIILNNEKKFIIGYMSEGTEIDRYILDELKKNNIKIIDLTLDKNDIKNELLDGHPSMEANLKRSLMIWNDLKNTFNE
jgi:energy-coupling factor transporter transmembrane protein EcfT